MKVCPKCNSSYTDETLNFCLTDGVPLVAQEILDEYLSKSNSGSWHTADTLVDARPGSREARVTAVNPSSPTFQLNHPTAVLPASRRGGTLLYLVGGILLLGLIGGGAWFLARGTGDVGQRALVDPTGPSTPKHAIVQLTPEQDAQVRSELTEFMKTWAKTNSDKKVDAHIALYATTLEVYYGESGKDKNHVRADRLRAYQRYDSIQMQVDNVKISPESTESATIVFDKSWTMKNDKKTSTGSVEQEVHVTKSNGRWLIDSERDLKVYFLNNRENSANQ